MEEGSLLGTLAFNCRHGYTQEEYARKRERGCYASYVDSDGDYGVLRPCFLETAFSLSWSWSI